MTIARTFEWDMGHRIPNHKSLCKNPHGHRYKLVVYVSGPMSKKFNDPVQGIVLDFSELKEIITTGIISKLDHSFMYWSKDSVMQKFAGDNPSLKFVEVPFIPTAECMVVYLAEEISTTMSKLSPKVSLIMLELNETPKSKAMWSQSR